MTRLAYLATLSVVAALAQNPAAGESKIKQAVKYANF
jgi:hypothetical protein